MRLNLPNNEDYAIILALAALAIFWTGFTFGRLLSCTGVLG